MNRRIVYTRAGGPDVLRLVEEAVPEPEAGMARVRVEATGVAFADIVQRNGLYPAAPPFPFSPGYDLCGHIDAIGPDSETDLRVGDRVAAITVFGSYADYVTVPLDHLVTAPGNVDATKVVAASLNYLTAFQMMERLSGVADGETALVHAAGGGVGSALLDLGRHRGLRMLGTVSARKRGDVEALGAMPIDYRKEDFVAVALRETGGEGVHAAFDAIGGAHWQRSLRAIRPGGRLVAYGTTGGFEGGRRRLLRLAAIYGRSYVAIMKLFMTSKSVLAYNVQTLRDLRAQWYRADFGEVLNRLADGDIDPLVAGTFPLERAGEAQELLVRGERPGKVVIRCRTEDGS
ncbi:zinc-binding dehydrogenase [Ferruginivarius sediminum]|uniref:Enoyl reductase (ER) domain-containing protein n=2 Tax=Pseudomonadota TaxID=1224 RepID=A0A369TD54_9PROT|nr:zinc-binding dehydrogenase [Ferruginivarius sediminum]RDD63281.1 hypothetical protein DRB17_02175 [Ferruginivarius sediminum]